jgi:hypothetical protein
MRHRENRIPYLRVGRLKLFLRYYGMRTVRLLFVAHLDFPLIMLGVDVE